MSIISRAYFVYEDVDYDFESVFKENDDDNSGGVLLSIGITWLCTVSESRPFINNVVPLPYICQLFFPKFFKSTNYI